LLEIVNKITSYIQYLPDAPHSLKSCKKIWIHHSQIGTQWVLNEILGRCPIIKNECCWFKAAAVGTQHCAQYPRVYHEDSIRVL
jgi:hypothetical protein